MKLGYSPWAFHGSIYPFDDIFSESARLDYTPVKNCDAIVLWGGTDIDPKYYGGKDEGLSHYNPDCPRNQAEWYWMQEAAKHGIPMIGVCRGAQFMCAFAGGKLYQHVTGHNSGVHAVTVLEDGQERVYQTASAHHQMMYPYNLPAEDYQLLGWSRAKRSTVYMGNPIPGVPPGDMKEPEVILFPKIKALAIQGHPEWQDKDEPFMQWVFARIHELVASQKQVEGVME